MSLPNNLCSRPVFGYEYSMCNANYRRMRDLRAYKNLLTAAQLMQIIKWECFLSNVFKLLGAFVPQVGIGRIILAFLKIDEQSKKEIFRGFAEALGKGKFLIVADLAVTGYRFFNYS